MSLGGDGVGHGGTERSEVGWRVGLTQNFRHCLEAIETTEAILIPESIECHIV